MGRKLPNKIAYKPKEQQVTTKKYPSCKGTFPDCPEEIKPDFVADVCKACPFFK